VHEVHQQEADFGLIYQLAQAFIALLHEHTDDGLTGWLAQVQRSAIPELLSFAGGINRDEWEDAFLISPVGQEYGRE
jgi:hypothetical protein